MTLDEPTEGLDAATEVRLVERLGQWLAGSRTGLILVSHRPRPLQLTSRQLRIEAAGLS